MPRAGYLTPSSFNDLMKGGRGKEEWGQTALAVIKQLTLDLLGVERPEEYTPASCQWGKDNEWLARETYSERTFNEVRDAAFTVAPDCDYVGGTMDGLVGKRGGIEIKCPANSLNHYDNIISDAQLNELYMYQVQGYMWVFGLDWVDFISYDPRWEAPNDLYIKRVIRDEAIIEQLKRRCETAYSMAKARATELSGEAV